ncbi:MAG: beta-galactosidase [Fibrobacterota bacterium]
MKVFEIQFHRSRHTALLAVTPEGYYPGETIQGTIPVEGGPDSSTVLQWVDALGRHVADVPLRYRKAENAYLFSLHLSGALFVFNQLICKVRGEAVAMAEFMATPIRTVWDDFHAITWASYPLGCTALLEACGIDGQITYASSPHSHVLKQFNYTYVDQIAFRALSWYHRHGGKRWESDRKPYLEFLEKNPDIRPAEIPNLADLVTRRYCLSEASTRNMISDRMREVVEVQRKSAPLFYNIADETGIADQAAPSDFCMGPACMRAFRAWLRKKFVSLDALNRAWATSFPAWDDVLPLTTGNTIDMNIGRKRKNFSAWMHHRAFMEKVMADTLAFAREAGRCIDPHGRFGTTGLQAPSAYGGWDFERLCRAVDVMIPYNMGNNLEIIRSLNPNLITLSPFFGNAPALVRHLWFHLFHNDRAFLFWDNHEKDGAFITLPGKKQTPRARLFGPHLREMREGIGKMILESSRRDDGIGIHYSQSSIHIHWMLENARLGKEWIKRSSFDEFNFNRFREQRESLVFAVEDSGRQHHFRSYRQMEDEGLSLLREKIFFLPGSVCLSEKETAALEQYVREGGVLVADSMAGTFDGNGVEQATGSLDALFGIVRHPGTAPKGTLRLNAEAVTYGLKAGPFAFSAAENIKAATHARALGKAGSADCIIVKKTGKGVSVYLNFNFEDYRAFRHETGNRAGRALRALFHALFKMAGIDRCVGLTRADGNHAPGLETVCYRNAGEEYVALTYSYNILLDDGTGGEVKKHGLRPYDKPQAIKVRFPKKAHVYDVRERRYLGVTDTHAFTFKPLDAKLFALLPARVKAVSLKAEDRAERGKPFYIRARVVSDGALLTGHTLHMDIVGPGNKRMFYYAQNVTLDRDAGVFTLPLALNDVPGRWKAVVRDVQSGVTAVLRFDVA